MENNLPLGWIETELSQVVSNSKYSIVDGPFGSHLKRSDYVTEGIPLVRILNIGEDYKFNEHDLIKITKAKFDEIKRSQINPGEILFSKAGTIGRVCFVPETLLIGAITSSCAKIKIHEILNSKFFLYQLSSSDVYNYLLSIATGSTRLNLNLQGIKTIPLKIPPLAEQHRIVAKLDSLLAKTESNKQRLEKIPIILKRFRQSVLAAAVSGNNCVEEIANNVCSEIQIGPFGTQLHKHDYISNGIPLVNPTHIQAGEIVPDMDLTISKAKFKELSNYHLQIGDVIMGRRGEMARCALVGKKENGWLCGTGSLFFRPDLKKVNPQYLFWVLSNNNTKAFLEGEAKGSTMSNLNLNIVRNIPIPLPPLSEQKQIVKRVEQLFAFADKLEARYTKAKTMIDKLPQSILAKAFRGELVSQNAEDEPASVLLERLKAEKEKLAAEKNGKKSKAYSIEEKQKRVAAEGKVKYKKAKVK